jgi:hypothetical protein
MGRNSGRGFKKFHDRKPNLRQLKTTTKPESAKNSYTW